MKNEESEVTLLREEIMKLLGEFFDQSKHQELSEEEVNKLDEVKTARYSRCHPIYCPNYGRPMPHTPHVPLYPTDWC